MLEDEDGSGSGGAAFEDETSIFEDVLECDGLLREVQEESLGEVDMFKDAELTGFPSLSFRCMQLQSLIPTEWISLILSNLLIGCNDMLCTDCLGHWIILSDSDKFLPRLCQKKTNHRTTYMIEEQIVDNPAVEDQTEKQTEEQKEEQNEEQTSKESAPSTESALIPAAANSRLPSHHPHLPPRLQVREVQVLVFHHYELKSSKFA
ncbi:2333_t:CDS:2 [Paraglomus occultum]|uniref:2333_t:CDS:1 n=1 Tax=Paraglomus occultum TaxID=144539 RepID=A0A9N9CX51_9GLOM|nr:2333_t:CDS:2 [Paraglomus occultum]